MFFWRLEENASVLCAPRLEGYKEPHISGGFIIGFVYNIHILNYISNQDVVDANYSGKEMLREH